jgi:hypothetical protein
MRDSFGKVEAEDLCERRPFAVVAKIIVGPVVSLQVVEEGSKKGPSRTAILILAGVRLTRFRRGNLKLHRGSYENDSYADTPSTLIFHSQVNWS